jgi:methylenetetrahydrofolate dehydrogenase (NADP+)/methenyltetrahydrofolate cyclohydrolase
MLIYGKDIAESVREAAADWAKAFRQGGVKPTLALVRIGERADDVAYEKSILSAAAKSGVRIISSSLPEATTQEELATVILDFNSEAYIHGIMLFRPLPSHIDEDSIRNLIAASKDVDGITDSSMAWVYSLASGESLDTGFAPCTAEAVIRTLDGASIDISHKRAVVIGRSLVIGKPVSMLLLARDATVTIAHSKTRNLSELTRSADIVVVCAGLASGGREGRLGEEYFRSGQTIVDCGINADADGLYGDVDTEAADALGASVTPVPGGLGAVTSAVLMEHVIRSAVSQMERING